MDGLDICALFSFGEVNQISHFQNRKQSPRDGVVVARQREVCCWRVTENRAESAARRWEFGAEMEQGRNKAEHHGSRRQRKHVAAKSCGVKPLPPSHLLFWSRPIGRPPLRGGSLIYPTSSPCSCFLHCSLLPLDSHLTACHLSVLSLPSSSPKCIFLVGFPAGPAWTYPGKPACLRTAAQECKK